MAVAITAAHLAALNLVRKATVPQMKQMLDQYELLCQKIDETGPSDVSMGAWQDAQYATQRAAIRVDLHAIGTALIVLATAVHDAAAGVVTDWT